MAGLETKVIPTFLSVALRFLYLFVFVCFAGMALMGIMGPWVHARFGAWVLWGGFGAYLCLIIGAFALINKINRDWPPLILPPGGRGVRKAQAEIKPSDVDQSERISGLSFAARSSGDEKRPETEA
jgi:hypothetical protein